MTIQRMRSLSKYISASGRLGVAALLITLISGCSFLPKEEPVLAPPLTEPAQMDYQTAEVKKGEIIKRVKGSGIMVPTSHYDLYYTKDGGRLKEIHVREGDTIEKGQTLAEIETGNLAFEIDQVKLDLKKAEIRLQQMRSQGSDKYSIQIANLDIDGLKSRLSYMNNQMAESKITSPIDGIVTFVSEIRQGESVNAYTSIFQVAETAQLEILYTAMNAADIADVNLGMETSIDLKGAELVGEVIQTPKNVPHDIYQSNPDLYSKSVLVSVEKIPEGVKVGDIAGIEIITATKEDTLIIPKNGLRTTIGRNYVQVIEDNSKREVDIEAGIISSTEVEVLKGLNEGDIIILK